MTHHARASVPGLEAMSSRMRAAGGVVKAAWVGRLVPQVGSCGLRRPRAPA